MEPDDIDWDNIDSTFEEDEAYEKFVAPKWVDLSAPDVLFDIDDKAWFCNSDCKHPKTAEGFAKSESNRKTKLLRSITMAEILPFRDRNKSRRNMKNAPSATEFPEPKLLKTTKIPSFSSNSHEDAENKDPNFAVPPLPFEKPETENEAFLNPQIAETTDKKQKLDESSEKFSSKQSRLKSTLSMRNLISGRDILNQISDFCSEMKKLATKSSKKGRSEKVSGGVLNESKKKVVKQRDRMPLIVREDTA